MSVFYYMHYTYFNIWQCKCIIFFISQGFFNDLHYIKIFLKARNYYKNEEFFNAVFELLLVSHTTINTVAHHVAVTPMNEPVIASGKVWLFV